jgi:Ni/Co efflux regulator RcnB
MRKILGWALIAIMTILGFAASATAAKKKAAAKKTAAKSGTAKSGSKKSSPAASKKSGASSKKSAKSSRKSRSSKRSQPVKRTTWRNRQTSPAPERYKEIQDALASKGYLDSAEATGSWGASSVAALKRFQADQRIDGNGKINSLSLIALGLGSKPAGAVQLAPPDAAPDSEPAAPDPK